MAKPLAEDRVAVDKAEPPDRSPIDDVFAELSESFSDAPDPSAESEFEYSVEEVYADFKAGLAAVLKPEDVETHLDLAIAYGEMGLLDDARAEAAIALEHGATSLRTRAAEAVAILLHPDGLTQTRADALASLRIALFPD